MSDIGILTMNLRPSGDRVLLNLYVPSQLREAFVEGIARGSFSDKVRMSFEAAILPEWFNPEFEGHIKVPVTDVNVVYES